MLCPELMNCHICRLIQGYILIYSYLYVDNFFFVDGNHVGVTMPWTGEVMTGSLPKLMNN